MDWPNEEYVKVYRRETDDDLVLSWQARAMWKEMLVKFDRSGLIETRRGVRGLAAVVRWPVEVAEPALAELLEDGRVRAVPAGFFAPNFLEAQEASKSDKARQRESRVSRRLRASTTKQPVTPEIGHEVSASRDRVSRDEEPPVEMSLSAILDSADPSRSETPARAIPSPTPPVTQDTAWQRRQRWWLAMLQADARIRRAGIEQNAPTLPPAPAGANELNMNRCETQLAEAGFSSDEVDAKMLHIVAVAEAEAMRDRSRKYFKPSVIWKPENANRAADTSLEEARRTRAGPGAQARTLRVSATGDDPDPSGALTIT